MKKFALGILLIFWPATGFGQDTDPCEGQSRIELTVCAEKEEEKTEISLKKIWKLIEGQMEESIAESVSKFPEDLPSDSARLRQLRDSQKAWEKYRDLFCGHYPEEEQKRLGAEQPIYDALCRTLLTRQRIQALQERYNYMLPDEWKPKDR